MRIEDRNNAYLRGREVTLFKVYSYEPAVGGHVFAGQGYAPGHDASEEECKQAFLTQDPDD